MEDIKILVCDLDGTLLNDQKTISEYSKQMLGKAKEAGLKICLASGRDEQMMSLYNDLIGGCDYLISSNGALVRRPDKGQILCAEVMNLKETKKILQFFNDNHMAFTMYTESKMYYKKGVEKLEKRIADYEKMSAEEGYPRKLDTKAVDLSAEKAELHNVLKMVAYESEQEKLERLEELVKSCGLSSEDTGYGLKAVFAGGISKRKAVEEIMNDMNLESSNVCVFGDFDNDLSMFECAKYKVAMANAVSDIKAVATHITDSNNEDGVAKYIEQILRAKIK